MEVKRQVIDNFSPRLKYGFLSNFYPSTIYVDKKSYLSVEHAYQTHKTIDESAREIIRKSSTPQEAKKLGRCVQLREDWDQVKVSLMRTFLENKFDNPFLRQLLLATGDAELIHQNTWNDMFWGVCKGRGQNWLGRILMEIRDDIEKEAQLEL